MGKIIIAELEYLPLVSIVIPVYNRVNLIKATIQSVINQTYQNWECLIIDDGSSDGTIKTVEEFCETDKRIKIIIRDSEPKGAPRCRNIGIENSLGEYVIFLDSDDVMADECLERRIAGFQKYPDKDFLVFPSLLFKETRFDLNILWNIDSEEDDLERFLRIDAIWPICGPIYKRSVLLEINMFREDLAFWQDFDLHLRFLLLKYKYEKLFDMPPDIFIRMHLDQSISRSISFVEDENILGKRIDFYISQLNFINSHSISLNKSQKNTLRGVLYYFCNCYLLEHNNKRMFMRSWRRAKKSLKMNFPSYFLSMIFSFLFYQQKRSKYFIKLRFMFYSVFKNYIPDYKVLLITTLGKIQAKQNQ